MRKRIFITLIGGPATAWSMPSLRQQGDPLATHRAMLVFIVAIFVCFSILGIFRRYSPVPFGYDYWDYLRFYSDLLDGKHLAWFAVFADHRPTLPRVLFWLDVQYFGGRFVFLTVANLVILVGVTATFITYLRRLTSERPTQFAIGATVCIMAISWLHSENLVNVVSGAQYFTALLLPLVAFYWLARSQERQYFFWLALIAGFASPWTHGNGILVLPLLAMLAISIGLERVWVAMLVIASVATIALYFDLSRSDESPILGAYLSRLIDHPIAIARFAFGFLGNPFFYVVTYPLAYLEYLIAGAEQAARPIYGSGLNDYPTAFAIGFYIAQLAGVALILGAVVLAWRWFASGAHDATRGALLSFLFFIILTAVAGAAVRFYKVDRGFVEVQYATPALFGWITLIVLGGFSFNFRRAIGIFACVAICLLPIQLLPVFGPWRAAVADRHERELQAMQAILHGSNNPETLSILGADPVVVHRLRGTKVSIFADEL